jgi:hypothetical protein
MLSPAETYLRFMHKVGAEDRDVLLETRQHGPADPERLDGFLIRSGKQVLVARCGQAKDVAKSMGK